MESLTTPPPAAVAQLGAQARKLPRMITIAALVAWGALHVLGGLAFMTAPLAQSLAQAGSALSEHAGDPGSAGAARICFHDFDLLAAGSSRCSCR